MGSFFKNLLDVSDFPARWNCGSWSAALGWLHIISDLLIFVAYFAIPASIFVLMRRRRDVPFPAVLWLFIAFILSCGLTHLIEAGIFWWPAYRLSGLMKAITAVVSLATVVMLLRVLPTAIKIPDIMRSHGRLEVEVSQERAGRTELELARRDLERRAGELTVRERRMREAVGAAKACAVCWEVRTGAIVWEMGYAQAMRSAKLSARASITHWRELIGDAGAAHLAADSATEWERSDTFHRRFALLGHEGEWDIRMTATPDAEVAGQQRTMSGLFGLVPTKDSLVGH